jgi:hypothetical protein
MCESEASSSELDTNTKPSDQQQSSLLFLTEKLK